MCIFPSAYQAFQFCLIHVGGVLRAYGQGPFSRQECIAAAYPRKQQSPGSTLPQLCLEALSIDVDGVLGGRVTAHHPDHTEL